MKKTLFSVAIFAMATSAMANEYTFVFDGDNDMGGLTRQTTNKQADLTFSESFEMTEDGVDLSIKKIDGKGPGLALINAGGANAGLCVYSTFTAAVTPEISITVPNGKITSVKVMMSGTGLMTLELPFNGKSTESVNEGTLFSYTWTGEGVENVTCSWTNSFYQRYIHSIKVEYTPDLGGKEASELSFPASEYEGVMGESFVSPIVSNPNQLKVNWTSSNESVATVDAKGIVTLTGVGTTTITASTEGNDSYAAGNAKYVLNVIGNASNISELLEYAPAVYDRVKVNFPMTVNYGYLGMAYVTGPDGVAACINDISNSSSSSATAEAMYKAGQVIPAGWIATNATINESVIWEGKPSKSTETVEVSYAEVESVTKADADRVVVLKNVTFETTTASGTVKAFGTTPDGTSYEFQDTYELPSKPAGTYDVTCVVHYSKRGSTEYFYLSPISYAEVTGSGVEVNAENAGEAVYYDIKGNKVSGVKSGVYVKVTSEGKASKVIVK